MTRLMEEGTENEEIRKQNEEIGRKNANARAVYTYVGMFSVSPSLHF